MALLYRPYTSTIGNVDSSTSTSLYFSESYRSEPQQIDIHGLRHGGFELNGSPNHDDRTWPNDIRVQPSSRLKKCSLYPHFFSNFATKPNPSCVAFPGACWSRGVGSPCASASPPGSRTRCPWPPLPASGSHVGFLLRIGEGATVEPALPLVL